MLLFFFNNVIKLDVKTYIFKEEIYYVRTKEYKERLLCWRYGS